MSDYNDVWPKANGMPNNHNINTNYGGVFKSLYNFTLLQRRELHSQEIVFHPKRVSIKLDRRLGISWRSSDSFCYGLGLNFSSRQALIADTTITKSILVYVKSRCVDVSYNRARFIVGVQGFGGCDG